jgi:hypothetical protein
VGQVINDADGVKGFRSQLEDALRDTVGARTSLEKSLQEVRQSWQDARAVAAEREVMDAIEEMKKFEKDAQIMVDWLGRLEQKIRRYSDGGR